MVDRRDHKGSPRNYERLSIEGVQPPIHFALEADTNGFIIRRLAEFKDRNIKTNYFQLFYAILLYATNFVLQSSLTAFLLVAGAWMERPLTEPLFSQHHNMTMTKAIDTLNSASEKHGASVPRAILETCKPTLDMVSLSAYHLLVFVWITNMMSEFKGIRRFTIAVLGVEAQTNPDEPLFSEDGKTIIRIDALLRWFIVLGVTGARLFIALPLMYAGIKFLMLQNSTMALIMKVLAMRMVVSIDSQLIDNLLSKQAHTEIAQTEVRYIPGQRSTTTQKFIDGTEGMVYFFLTLLVLIVVVVTRFSTLMAFRRSCRAYYDSTHEVSYDQLFWEALKPSLYEI
mmetsp:Transcript_120198/g.256514  ORF Transcript_120198/g.256514 Transcript_120198/m.256514 type:complete len:341 (-) Transcript_120198:76-1098(-)